MTEDEEEDVVLIHRKVANRFVSASAATATTSTAVAHPQDLELALLRQHLTSLQKRREDLYFALQQVQFDQCMVPLGEELRTTTARRCRRHFVEEKDQPQPPSNQPGDLAHRIHTLRKRRRIAGSHRIAGVSIAPYDDDDNVLSIRLDISVEGRYVAKHFLFFEVKEAVRLDLDGGGAAASSSKSTHESSPCYYLKLAQHTLPRSISLTNLLKQHFGSQMMLSLTTADDSLSEDIMIKLRGLVGNLQDVCYAHAVRQRCVDYLNEQTQKTGSELSITNFVVNPDTLTQIDFEVHYHKATMLTVKLQYDDVQSPLPTKVSIATASGNDNHDDEQLERKAIKILQSKPVWLFLKELSLSLSKKVRSGVRKI